MADRTGRVRALLTRNIMDICQMELKNPKIGFVSVNEVRFSKDNSIAKVYVSFLGAKYPHQNFAELIKTEGYVRSSLAKRMDLYKVPEIVFVYDSSFEEAASLEEALNREEEDLEKIKKGL